MFEFSPTNGYLYCAHSGYLHCAHSGYLYCAHSGYLYCAQVKRLEVELKQARKQVFTQALCTQLPICGCRATQLVLWL